MGHFLGRFVLPLLLLGASLLNWSLISLINLLMFLGLQYMAPKRGLSFWRLYLLWCIIIFSILAILTQMTFHMLWCIEGNGWSVANTWWAKLVGFARVQPWGSSSVIYFILIQLASCLVAFVEVSGNSLLHQDSCWLSFSSAINRIGSHLRVACCLTLPAIQLVLGISHPSWILLPFFICSCVGLVDWSLTSNFLGLYRWWKTLLIYSCFSILLLYVYQLPIQFPDLIMIIAEFIGLYKITGTSEWPEISSGVSLLIFFFMLSFVKRDLEEMDSILYMDDGSLTERLLPSKHSFFIRESRNGVRHTNVLLRGSVFRSFSINFFTYGFPVLLLALSFWSFSFASVCAFGLLAYVGYVLYAFPSLFQLHRLNGLLLVFILLWAASTYVFNVAFTFLNKKLRKDVEIWETIGFWHYSIPGLFLLAQFCLGVFVAMGNLVSNSVFLYLSDGDGQISSDGHKLEEKEDTKVLIVATLAWGLRKCSRPITLALIFLLSTKAGFIHAIYMCFFLAFLLSHSISRKMRQALILFCEGHFSIMYILQLKLVSTALEQNGSLTREILSQLGLPYRAASKDFWEIGILLCFCAVQNHGFKMLFSLSAIIQHTPHPPFGFSILRAGLNKSVLLSVYASSSLRAGKSSKSSHEKLIATYLSTIGQKFLSAYRSYGTYIAFLTILLTVYLMVPNYVSFGYLFFLFSWIIGRQLVEKTRRRLWFPLKVYATVVFVVMYILCISSSFQKWLSKVLNLYHDMGFNTEASIFENVWESLAVLIVMQLYSYERRQSKYSGKADGSDAAETGLLAFARRVLIWHSDKLLSAAVFYASISPISAFGFLYLLVLIIFCTFPKASRLPSKLFLSYSGLLVISEYLFQMWGKYAQMFPGQHLHGLSLFLGFRLYDPGFWGIESGLRGKILVIVGCTLQYNVSHWLENMPSYLVNKGKWEEPCQLFLSSEHTLFDTYENSREDVISVNSHLLSLKQRGLTANSCPSLTSASQTGLFPSETRGSDKRSGRYSFSYIWGCLTESKKWNRRRVNTLRKERFEMQKTTLTIFLKFWIENLFKLRGLEVNMIVLLLASFAVLNAISLFYIVCLVVFIFLKSQFISKFWPVFVFSFASILIVEYFAIWKSFIPWISSSTETEAHCHDCWSSSRIYFDYCKKCWLGIIVDDPRMLLSYYMVFVFSSYKLRCDRQVGFSNSRAYHQMVSQRKNALVWKDLSFETKGMWTFLDYVRLYCYCHLLDIVLALILITGTLEYDVLHFGYLCFALIFFRMRLAILKKKNKIFNFLRFYNFALIVLSLAYQSPYLGEFCSSQCEMIDYIYEIIGFYKYDYGFRITSRSALVEIVIFLLVSMQSYMFRSTEFDYVARYLEAEQIGAMAHEQEKRAAWKTAQLQHIRKSEEQKRQRNMQVEKMKSEMLNLQTQLRSMNSIGSLGNTSAEPFPHEGLKRRRNSRRSDVKVDGQADKDSSLVGHPQLATDNSDDLPRTQKNDSFDFSGSDLWDSLKKAKGEYLSTMEYVKHPLNSSEISEYEEEDITYQNVHKEAKHKVKENPLLSAVQFIGDGVSQVQTLGNQAVSNIVSFLNIEQDESESNGHSSTEDGVYDGIESQDNSVCRHLNRISSVQSDTGDPVPAASLQIRKIFNFIWSQMRSNNDVVCYCCFVLIFLWNFSLLSMVYLAALFLYALCVSTGPCYLFWFIMLIYTEINILLQYLYQIVIQHVGLNIVNYSILKKLGFPAHKITASFVISTLPLFLVYITTLLQRSITAQDGEWAPVSEVKSFNKSFYHDEYSVKSRWLKQVAQVMSPILNVVIRIVRGFYRYWTSLTQGSESPPYFVQLSMKVDHWPEDGIQPDKIESKVNELLRIAHEERCDVKVSSSSHYVSSIRIQSIERSQENPNLGLAVLEVIYASAIDRCPNREWYLSLTPAADVAKEILDANSAGLFEEVDFPYPVVSVIGGGKREVDLYAYIFGADLAVFFLVAMFYQSVIKNNSKLLDVYQLEDQFPKEFVFILMILFFLIVLDRIIYLWSFAIGKVIFYLFNLVLFTYSVTEYAWYMEPSYQSVGGLALRAIFLTKAVSLALQAIQIRCGIPNKSTLYRQFLTCKITQVNYLGFRLYRALPFLYELRCVLDWSCTSTSLTMYDWLKLEDINASLFLVKCDNDLNRASHKQGERQSRMTKFCSGICLFFVLICVIWAPMLMYSSGNPTNIANPIVDVSVQIDVKAEGGRLTLFQTTLCEKYPWEELDFHEELDQYLDTYNGKDIQLICCQPDASTMWIVPPLVTKRFIRSLGNDMNILFSWVFIRERPKGKELVKYEIPVEDCPSPSEVKEVLNGTADSLRLSDVYPRYFRVTGSGEVRSLEQTVDLVSGDLFLNHGIPSWWSFYDSNVSYVAGCKGLSGPMAIVVSEETPQGILGETLSKFSIWSLYLTFVLAVGRFIRLQCSDLRMRIPYENLPSCDRLIAICEDIYAARAEGELEVEEVLYWTLVKIYRSPHMLLEYTKPD